MPPRFRAMTHYGSDTEPFIRNAVTDAELDPVAMMEHLARPLPIPPGAVPLRCRTSSDTVFYTLGVEASPAYMAARNAYDAEQSGPSQRGIQIVNGEIRTSRSFDYVRRRRELAASPTTIAAKRRTEAFLLGAGFVRSGGDTIDRTVYRPGQAWQGHTPIVIRLNDDAFGVGDDCLRRGIPTPWGPTMEISYDLGL